MKKRVYVIEMRRYFSMSEKHTRDYRDDWDKTTGEVHFIPFDLCRKTQYASIMRTHSIGIEAIEAYRLGIRAKKKIGEATGPYLRPSLDLNMHQGACQSEYI